MGIESEIMSVSQINGIEEVFIGESEMAALMRQHDWAATSLGAPENWPNALKVAVRILLTSRFEMWLGWGPDINFLYNDAYRPTLANKHPKSLGMPTKELWAEIWDDVKGRLETVYTTGQATWDKALLLFLHRSGYPEETYHTFSYSPLVGDSGIVEGVFCAVTEETDRVIGERRLSTLRQLASALSSADSHESVRKVVCQELSNNLSDLPFSLLYRFDPVGTAHLECANGISEGHPIAQKNLDVASTVWPLSTIRTDNKELIIDISDFPELPTGVWKVPPAKAAIVPLAAQGGGKPLGVFIAGLNPHRPIDDDYVDFLKLLGGQISASLASAEAFESERKRADALADAVRLRQKAAETLRQANMALSTEVELRTQERDRMRDLFQQAPSFMCILRGPQHVFELVNDAYLQLVGHRDLIGLTIYDALPEIQGQGYFELLDNVLKTGEPYIGRHMPVMIQRTPDAALEQRFVNLIYQPIFGADGSVTGIFVDGYDVTHQKRAEEQLRHLNQTLEQRIEQRTHELTSALARLEREVIERKSVEEALQQAQKMESLGKLTGGVAHDFNNLLQVISGNLQLLSREVAGNARAERRVHNAMAGVSRGAKLASQLLAFGRRQPLEPKVLNVGKLIKNMDDMLRRSLGEEIALETVVSGGLWNTLIDPAQVENAILNLAINARDAMDGLGRLTIEASNAALDDAYARTEDVNPGQYVLVAVTDTGSGMPAELLDRVIEPFFTTKGEGKGTGLGLSMVYGLVKQSGGHFKIYSEVGQGTTIKMYFPRVHQGEEILTDVKDVPVRGGKETILVVEDDDDVRDTSVSLLTELGYHVLKARDAQSAFSIIDSGLAIDLLFTDVVMPGPMRSPELARLAKERLPNIAVLFTSGYTENAIVHGGRLDLGVELLSKPYTREALARKIRKVLGNEAQHQIASSRSDANMAPIAAEANKLAQLNILLVEDDDFIREYTSELLKDFNHNVIAAPDATTALESLKTFPADVLITDVGLPVISGTDLAREVRRRWPRVRIIFASGDDAGAAESGINDAIQLLKPYTVSDLENALNRALN